MGIMRRFVRYTPLGKGRTVSIVLNKQNKRDAEILDESRYGLGLRVDDVMGLAVGGRLAVDCHNRTHDCMVKRIVAAPDGGYLVGVEFTDGAATSPS